jgi:hypothetical protein
MSKRTFSFLLDDFYLNSIGGFHLLILHLLSYTSPVRPFERSLKIGSNLLEMELHGQALDPQEPYPPTPPGAGARRCTSAQAPVGHPPVSEIRRSMVGLSPKGC